jgi:hypothetical protein
VLLGFRVDRYRIPGVLPTSKAIDVCWHLDSGTVLLFGHSDIDPNERVVDGRVSLHISAQPSASRPDDREEGPLLPRKTKFVHELRCSRCEPPP